MLKPQAKSPAQIFQNGAVRTASVNVRADTDTGLRAMPPEPRSGSRSVPDGAASRITKSAMGIVTTANTTANPASVTRQPADSMASVRTGVMTAMPAIDPVDRKNSAMPRCRVNQRLMTGVSATGLVNARPVDNSTPNESMKVSGVVANTDQVAEVTTIAVPVSRTNFVPRRATR